MNDNGGTVGVKRFAAGMRGAKGTPWLGGTRASSFWRWPGRFTPGDCRALAAHVDVFPTLAALAGAEIPPAVRPQVEGRSLVPLLENPSAPWPDRLLVTHVGRWGQGEDPDGFKFRTCAVRVPRWTLVSVAGGRAPAWQLFDVAADYAQQHDVAADHPEVVASLAEAYDRWWTETRPLLVNEQARGPEINPFQALYYAQFGGSPTPEALRRMKPARAADVATPR